MCVCVCVSVSVFACVCLCACIYTDIYMHICTLCTQKSSSLKFCMSHSRSDVTNRCHHNSSHFIVPMSVHSWHFVDGDHMFSSYSVGELLNWAR